MSVKIYHNQRCSKSRKTLELLRENNVEPEIIEYLKHPPDVQTLKSLLKKLGLNARQLMRSNEQAYRDAGLDNPDLGEAALIEAMHEHPILIERPIVVNGNQAAVGRPPENVLKII
jgi:arsenate reductase